MSDGAGTDVLDPAPVQEPADRRPSWSPYQIAVLALTVLVLVWRAWLVSRWTWDFDDWVYMADTRSMSFGAYLMQDYNGHLMPAEFLLSWLVTYLAPLNFVVPVVLVSTACAASTWLWGRAFAALAGERLILLVPLALVSLSPLSIRPTIWWASALQAVPLQIFMALTVLAAARLATSGARRDLGLLILALLGGLLFWEKAVLLLIPATAVLLHLGSGSLLERIRRILAPLAVLAGLTAAYLALYLTLARGAEEDTGPVVDFRAGRGVSTSLDFFWRGLGELFAPGLLGGPWGTMPLQNNPFIRPPVFVAVVSVALVAAAAVWAVRRHLQTWLPLLMATSYTVVSLALVLYSRRFDVLGTTAVNDERYVVDAFAIAVLAGVMVMGSPRRRTPQRGSRSRARAAGVVAGALAVSLVAGNVAAVTRIGTHPGKEWVDNLRAGLQREAPVGLLDTYAPDRVLPPSYWADDARLSRMLSPLGSDVGFGGPVDQLWTVDDDGHVRKVVVDEAVRSEPGPTPDCGYAIAPGQTVSAPMSDQLFALDWVVQVDTLAAEGGPLTVDLGEQAVTLVAGPGLGQYQFAYRGEVPATIQLSMSPDSGTTCVTGVSVGTVKVPKD